MRVEWEEHWNNLIWTTAKKWSYGGEPNRLFYDTYNWNHWVSLTRNLWRRWYFHSAQCCALIIALSFLSHSEDTPFLWSLFRASPQIMTKMKWKHIHRSHIHTQKAFMNWGKCIVFLVNSFHFMILLRPALISTMIRFILDALDATTENYIKTAPHNHDQNLFHFHRISISVVAAGDLSFQQ